jgi:hypothetical protein
MPVPNSNFDQLSAITRRHFVPKMVDNIFDSIALLQRWRKNEVYKSIPGGTKIIQPLQYAKNSSGGWYSRADTLTTTDNDIFTSAEYEWKNLYENITIFGVDEMKNSGGDAAVLNYVQEKVKACEMTIVDRLGTSIYSDGTTANEAVGLRAIVATSNTIGNISQTSNSWWQAQVSADTVMTLASLNTLYSNCSINNNKPTVIVSDSDEWDRYYNLLQPQQRFQDKATADGGFTSLMFRGSPWIDDAAGPANTVFMLNEKFLHLYYHPKRDFKMEDFVKPTNQDAKVAKIFFMGAMGSSNNRMHGKVAYTA